MRAAWVAALVAAGAFAGAAADTAQAAVTCRYHTVTGVRFGNYDVLSSSNTTSNGTIAFRCTGITSGTATVSLDLSRGSSGSYTPRYMLSGLTQLDYNLYLDPAYALIWGDGTGGSVAAGPIVVTNNQLVTLTVYGRIPAGQDVPAGSYTDRITATINF